MTIVCDNVLNVVVYLSKHQDMCELVELVCTKALEEIEADELALECYQDPEIDDSYLTLYVRCASYEGFDHNVISNFRSQFYPIEHGFTGKLLVTTDFNYPHYKVKDDQESDKNGN